jgi:hypothetical protein
MDPLPLLNSHFAENVFASMPFFPGGAKAVDGGTASAMEGTALMIKRGRYGE